MCNACLGIATCESSADLRAARALRADEAAGRPSAPSKRHPIKQKILSRGIIICQ